MHHVIHGAVIHIHQPIAPTATRTIRKNTATHQRRKDITVTPVRTGHLLLAHMEIHLTQTGRIQTEMRGIQRLQNLKTLPLIAVLIATETAITKHVLAIHGATKHATN
ncbi:hypothetical protein VCR4J5_1500077 [Vibrio crassostreae]|uniref:Uncharacterized protein n=1 Tax=Vibrio crassostreae TaxID=246167 RepID=A0ABP1WSV3_9VIBR|nr:hypothetical protein VCR19J5_1210271 [Vibrio crassostreae]CDT09682.1 hypothetical protein VCR4J5_1500077 [Vibrio crassostreae]